jgi:hypothetical protein
LYAAVKAKREAAHERGEPTPELAAVSGRSEDTGNLMQIKARKALKAAQ